MSFQDYIKYLTEQFVSRMDTQNNRKAHKQQRSRTDSHIHHWFGLFPLSWKLWRTK